MFEKNFSEKMMFENKLYKKNARKKNYYRTNFIQLLFENPFESNILLIFQHISYFTFRNSLGSFIKDYQLCEIKLFPETNIAKGNSI